MSFRLRRNESVDEGVRRIARQEIGSALAKIDDECLPLDRTVHEVRKHCKKLRGLLRLVRPGFEETYRQENAWFRDAAQDLSGVRDADVLIRTFDRLVSCRPGQLDASTTDSLRGALEQHRRVFGEQIGNLNERLDQFAHKLTEARERIADWRLERNGFDVIGAGVEAAYRRGRRTMKNAYADPTPENFHEWRKRAKDHWYHMRLLRGLWKQEMQTRRDAAESLSELLGDDHDLIVLREKLCGETIKLDGQKDRVAKILAMIDARRLELQATARPLGKRLYAEKPSELIDRLHAYWKVWRSAKGSARSTDKAASIEGVMEV